MSKDPVYVTRPSLPPLADMLPYLEKIWQTGILTNGGPMHQELELALARYLNVPYISLFSNATIALITAFKALHLSGEVITTPYSFVATSHALMWNQITPVFVDIDPLTLNLNPDLIEAAITDKTTAILPVHCYGVPCNIEAIQAIADKHGLKVIYDAAHAFSVRQGQRSLLSAGDLSVLSFHATKVFNTFEGGAIVSPDEASKQHIDHLKNFGFVDEVSVVEIGINGKMNEFQAAVGLLQLQRVDAAIQRRAEIDRYYRKQLANVKGISFLHTPADWSSNFSYFPIQIGSEFPVSRDALYHHFKQHDIHPRRYFYPLIPEFEMYRHLASANIAKLPIAKQVSERVLCLPIYPDMPREVQQKIVSLILKLAQGAEA